MRSSGESGVAPVKPTLLHSGSCGRQRTNVTSYVPHDACLIYDTEKTIDMRAMLSNLSVCHLNISFHFFIGVLQTKEETLPPLSNGWPFRK